MLALNRLGESHELTLVWVPDHQGIPSNETGWRNWGHLRTRMHRSLVFRLLQEKPSLKTD